MKSPFDLETQNRKIDAKIVAAFERIFEAFRVLLWEKSKRINLSPIQIQILIFLKNHDIKHCTLSSLVDEFNMTPATLSDAVKVLREKKLVSKIQNIQDKRIFYLKLTERGEKIVEENSDFIQILLDAVNGLADEEQENLFGSLIKIIKHLNDVSVVTTQRMCFTCTFLQKQNTNFYCELLQMNLRVYDLRIDCPEHIYTEPQVKSS